MGRTPTLAGRHRFDKHYSRYRAAFDDAALYSLEHQLLLASTTGKSPRWKLHLDRGHIDLLTRNGLIITAALHPIAVTDREQTLTWAWAHPNITAPRTEAATQVRHFGQANRISLFTRPRHNLSRSDATADNLTVATKIIHRLWFHMQLPLPDGDTLYTALHLPDLALPTPTAAAVAQTVRTAAQEVTLTKPSRALASYAALRGIAHQSGHAGHAVRLLCPDGAVDVELDDTTIRTVNIIRATPHTLLPH